jgi:hypothetical protein
MSDPYFQDFPIIDYANNAAVDITRRAVVLDTISPFAYYPYTVNQNQRPDQIADRYYQDGNKFWLVFLANQMIDPFYDWTIDDNSFQQLLYTKYGSITESQLRVKYWQNQWVDDDNRLTPEGYLALPDGLRKYYTPFLNQGFQILYYTRAPIDWTVTTNMVVNYGISNTTGSGFKIDERLKIYANNIWIGNSQVVFSNSTVLSVQHVFGNTTAGDTVVAVSSNTHANISSVTVSVVNIPAAEQVFWIPVYYYDYEFGLNEKKKHIRLIDAKYSGQAARELAKDLNTL